MSSPPGTPGSVSHGESLRFAAQLKDILAKYPSG